MATLNGRNRYRTAICPLWKLCLSNMGLKFEVDEEDDGEWGDIPEEAIEGN